MNGASSQRSHHRYSDAQVIVPQLCCRHSQLCVYPYKVNHEGDSTPSGTKSTYKVGSIPYWCTTSCQRRIFCGCPKYQQRATDVVMLWDENLHSCSLIVQFVATHTEIVAAKCLSVQIHAWSVAEQSDCAIAATVQSSWIISNEMKSVCQGRYSHHIEGREPPPTSSQHWQRQTVPTRQLRRGWRISFQWLFKICGRRAVRYAEHGWGGTETKYTLGHKT